jgi:hypothetical protein
MSLLRTMKYGAKMTHVRVGIYDKERHHYHALEQIVARNLKRLGLQFKGTLHLYV